MKIAGSVDNQERATEDFQHQPSMILVSKTWLPGGSSLNSNHPCMTQRFHEEGDDEIIYDDSSDEEINDGTIDVSGPARG